MTSHVSLLLACSLSLAFASQPCAQAQKRQDNLPVGLSTNDWRDIQSALETERYIARPTGGGFRFWNPGQQWLIDFDGRGFSALPNGDEWGGGLELVQYGFEGDEVVVSEPVRIGSESNRVSYYWDENLTEWFINDARGLEHGFTLQSRPTSDDETGAENETNAVTRSSGTQCGCSFPKGDRSATSRASSRSVELRCKVFTDSTMPGKTFLTDVKIREGRKRNKRV